MKDDAPRFLGSNLKMANGREATMALLDTAVELSATDERQFFFFPSMVFVAEAVDRVAGSDVVIGAQGCSVHHSGAFTGEVSASMLAEVGAQAVMVGHYERVLAGESLDSFVKQARRAGEMGLRVLFCLGEQSKAQDPHDATDLLRDIEFISAELHTPPWVIAYEPHWAIGEHGQRPQTSYVKSRLEALRNGLNERGWNSVPIVYGGSVDTGNALSLDPLASGLFVGRAAWTPEGLTAICEMTQRKEKE